MEDTIMFIYLNQRLNYHTIITQGRRCPNHGRHFILEGESMKSIIIQAYNKNDVYNLYVHDSTFGGFAYDHFSGTIHFTLTNDYLKKKFFFSFQNVIYQELLNCHLWMDEPLDVYDLELCKEDVFQSLYMRGAEEGYVGVLYEKKYVGVTFTFTSGDRLTIICESIVYHEEPYTGECETEQVKWY